MRVINRTHTPLVSLYALSLCANAILLSTLHAEAQNADGYMPPVFDHPVDHQAPAHPNPYPAPKSQPTPPTNPYTAPNAPPPSAPTPFSSKPTPVKPQEEKPKVSAFKDNSKSQTILENKGLVRKSGNDDSVEDSFEDKESDSLAPMQNLHAIQSNFFSKRHSKRDNTTFIDYHIGETYNVRLRYAMTTTFIFNDNISQVILGDEIGFSTKMLGTDKEHLIGNILLIKPLQIGVDSNLTIVGKSGKVYSFYIFSTNYTSHKTPALIVYVSSKDFFKPLRKPAEEKVLEPTTTKNNTTPQKPTAHKKTAKRKKKPKTEAHKSTPSHLPSKEPPKALSPEQINRRYASDAFSVITNHTKDFRKSPNTEDDFKKLDYTAQVSDDGKYLRIGDAINHIYIEKSKIERGYVIMPFKKRKWYCFWICKKPSKKAHAFKPLDIFNDQQFTYFKFDRANAHSKFPVLYKVVDGYDNPVNSRVVGDYIIAEDVSDVWDLKMGKDYICVKKLHSKSRNGC
ncbi:TrbG/VirB9 family P-type conjugative transfer protein [Helicobacter suis]|uniref:VirB9 type IV secretion protein VirB9-2 n=1 Tax=Helicobacter suis TaxID=104628 RepID=A0A6J4CVZ5_9HELI|nr:TrbG/VirB9 family P-type conjugative transfer protein [Helicobacter suis]EFX43382.1 VirB9 [Helicobacter suis HS1]BCD45182.1 VirB9 type IV secretion protein VirB9-2 [Helicobacter suis]BCD47087.1 VirB9 type IV secretion protein VirB9-2 [Helicobacter suis]BCD48844.1 VirB9 type IV secretion protein VirB9-2 [Helicobacter suis]BCD50624.1 VirB9 type IV secretion protein VirB9-2 [Helicobacter suis]